MGRKFGPFAWRFCWLEGRAERDKIDREIALAPERTIRMASKNSQGKPVAVIIGATSKWQADGRNTKLAHGKVIDDKSLPVGARWGVGGALAQKFPSERFFTALTTPTAS